MAVVKSETMEEMKTCAACVPDSRHRGGVPCHLLLEFNGCHLLLEMQWACALLDGIEVEVEDTQRTITATDCVIGGILYHHLDRPVPENVHLGEEGVVGDTSEEVPLTHVLWRDLLDKLFQEKLERLGHIRAL